MEDLQIEIVGHIAVIMIDRPPVNAVRRDTYREIVTLFDSLEENKDIRTAVLTGAGTRAFVAGADLKDLASRENSTPSDILDPGRLARRGFSAILRCAVPVVAAINGPAIGAGLALASVCDVIVASDAAWFQVGEINVGLLGAGRHLQRMVGPYKARMMYFTGERVSAAELYRLGAVERVVKSDELRAASMEVAEEIASKSPVAIRLAKRSLNRVESLPLEEGYELEQDMTARLQGFDDAREASNAFLEHRQPQWRWR